MIEARVLFRRQIAAGLILALLGTGFPSVSFAQDSEVSSEKDAPDPNALFQKGVQAYHAKEYARAIALFREVFQYDPNPFMLYNVGRCYEELGEWNNAARYYQRSLSLEGLPQEAKIEALQRLEGLEEKLQSMALQNALMQARGFRILGITTAMREADRAADALARQETPPPLPPMPEAPPPPERTHWSPVGIATIGLGIASLGTGLALYRNLSQDLDRHEALQQEYHSLRHEALNQGDPARAATAIRVADEANRLGDQIQNDQNLSLTLLGLGSTMILGGAALYWWDTPVQLSPSPQGASLHVSW